MAGSLWVSWKNRILGNQGHEAFDPFEAHVLKSPPDPVSSYALRTRCARAEATGVVIRGNGLADLVGDCIAVHIGNLDRVGRTIAGYPPDPRYRHTTHTRTSSRVNPDRYHTAMADIGPEMHSLSLLENDAH
jgi:hypothetical protein